MRSALNLGVALVWGLDFGAADGGMGLLWADTFLHLAKYFLYLHAFSERKKNTKIINFVHEKEQNIHYVKTSTNNKII